MSKKSAAATLQEPASFEAAMAELEALVARMEEGELPLEESISAYQRGAELLRHCEKILADAEQRIKVLMPDGNDGTLQDYDDQA
ncbi:MAG: exodeoxyribonuclease VII small subunit [Burkholderiales bacterium]